MAYEEAGGKIDDYDRVLELHKSLPVIYDDALSFYEQKDPNTRSYDMYRNVLLQRHKRQEMWTIQNRHSSKMPERSTGKKHVTYVKIQDMLLETALKMSTIFLIRRRPQ